MKLLLALVAMLMLSSLALAAPETHQLGAYNVSFDMNTATKYEVQTAQPFESDMGKAYQMRIFTDNSTSAVIGITEYNELTDATIQTHKSLMPLNMIVREGLNVTNVEDKTIDRKEGFLVTSMPFAQPSITVYRALFWLDSNKCECGPVSVGKTSVMISSTYPKDVTESLLGSIQIAAGQATA